MTEKIVGPIKLSYTGSIFGLFLELLTDLTVQTAFVEMGVAGSIQNYTSSKGTHDSE